MTMETTQHISADTPLSVVLEKFQASGQRIVLTGADGRPIADVVPHVAFRSGAGLLDEFVPEGTSVSIKDMRTDIAKGASRGFRS